MRNKRIKTYYQRRALTEMCLIRTFFIKKKKALQNLLCED